MVAKSIHEGHNVKRLREILGVKQETLAGDLGLTQQALSAIEQKEALPPDMLEKIAASLKIPADAIKKFNDEAFVTNISCTFNEQVNYHFNSPDKVLEEVKLLYERFLKTEQDKIALLEKMLSEK